MDNACCGCFSGCDDCEIVEEAKEKLKKINVRDCCLWWSLIIYDQKDSTHPTFFNPQFML